MVAECGCRWWFQAAASPPFSSVSAFPLSVSVFASSFVSHGAGAVNNDGEDGSGSGVALVVAMRTAAGGSSPFSPSSFSLPRLGNGVGGAVAVLLVCAEAKASSSSRVLQQGEEDGERLCW